MDIKADLHLGSKASEVNFKFSNSYDSDKVSKAIISLFLDYCDRPHHFLGCLTNF